METFLTGLLLSKKNICRIYFLFEKMAIPKIGDTIFLEIDKTKSQYMITSKEDDKLVLTNYVDTSDILKMYVEPESHSWKIEGLEDGTYIMTISKGSAKLAELPDDVLFSILVYLNYKDIDNVCSVNELLNKRICSNERFWQRKYFNDFGSTTIKFGPTWREKYMTKLYEPFIIFAKKVIIGILTTKYRPKHIVHNIVADGRLLDVEDATKWYIEKLEKNDWSMDETLEKAVLKFTSRLEDNIKSKVEEIEDFDEDYHPQPGDEDTWDFFVDLINQLIMLIIVTFHSETLIDLAMFGEHELIKEFIKLIEDNLSNLSYIKRATPYLDLIIAEDVLI